MYRFIYHKWWKVLTLGLLLYVFIVGFLVPLKPGILSVSKMQIERGVPFKVDVITYNTQWDDQGEISAYFKYDSTHLWAVPGIILNDRRNLSLSGVLPAWKSSFKSEFDDLTLIIHHKRDGFLILPSAFIGLGPSDGQEPSWTTEIPEYGEWTWQFPFQAILYETIRNTFFHVAIWMAMFVLLVVSLVYSIKYLISRDTVYDAVASSFAYVAVVWGTMGMITGSVWAKATWGTYWTNDPKLNMSAVAMMIFLAYTILRGSISDEDRRAQLSSAYNIFAFLAMIPLVFIIPRLSSMSSMHPGNGGNPALGGEDLDHTLGLIFYPAIIAYTLLGVWMASLLFRLRKIEIHRIYSKLKK
jgi:heme exporter protein C